MRVVMVRRMWGYEDGDGEEGVGCQMGSYST